MHIPKEIRILIIEEISACNQFHKVAYFDTWTVLRDCLSQTTQEDSICMCCRLDHCSFNFYIKLIFHLLCFQNNSATTLSITRRHIILLVMPLDLWLTFERFKWGMVPRSYVLKKRASEPHNALFTRCFTQQHALWKYYRRATYPCNGDERRTRKMQ